MAILPFFLFLKRQHFINMNDSWPSYLPLKHIFSPLNCSPVLHLYSRRWVSILKNQSNLPPWVLQILCLLFFFLFPLCLSLFPLPFPSFSSQWHFKETEASSETEGRKANVGYAKQKKTWTPPGTRCEGRPAHHTDKMLIVTPVITRSLPREPNLHTRRDTCAHSRWRRNRRDVHLMKSLITLRWVRPVTDDISIPLKLRPLLDPFKYFSLVFRLQRQGYKTITFYKNDSDCFSFLSFNFPVFDDGAILKRFPQQSSLLQVEWECSGKMLDLDHWHSGQAKAYFCMRHQKRNAMK